MASDKHLEKAKSQLALKSVFDIDGRKIHIALIISDSPPLEARWHKGKEVHIIAVDVDGNFFLRHSSGKVTHWTHATATHQMAARSIREFVSGLQESKGTA